MRARVYRAPCAVKDCPVAQPCQRSSSVPLPSASAISFEDESIQPDPGTSRLSRESACNSKPAQIGLVPHAMVCVHQQFRPIGPLKQILGLADLAPAPPPE